MFGGGVGLKDRLFGDLGFRFAESRRGHSIFCLEAAVERDRIGKAACHAHLLYGKLRLFVQEADGMVEAQLTHQVGHSLIVARMGESGTDALLRQTSAVDERLTLKARVEE